MRELKYRVYIPEFSKFVYFGLNDFDYSDRYLDNPEHPVQQYTGMKDKYGKDIYEGDIVINTTSKEEYCSPAVIVWGKYEFVGFALAYKRNKLEDYHAPLIHKINGIDLVEEFNLSKIGIYQIVGNVSENPELLK
jgi:uncharacterized phage protein (TIGR01671 family)